jgi:hypothetical protein
MPWAVRRIHARASARTSALHDARIARRAVATLFHGARAEGGAGASLRAGGLAFLPGCRQHLAAGNPGIATLFFATRSMEQTCRGFSWYDARVAAKKGSGEVLVTTGCATGTGATPEGAPVMVIRFTGEAKRKFRPCGTVDE